jgi:hypothetical protein
MYLLSSVSISALEFVQSPVRIVAGAVFLGEKEKKGMKMITDHHLTLTSRIAELYHH